MPDRVRLPHLELPRPRRFDFQARQGRGDSPEIPVRDRESHGRDLLAKVSALEQTITTGAPVVRAPGAEGHLVAADGQNLPLSSLSSKPAEAVVVGTTPTGALVHLRRDDLAPLRRKIAEYADPSKDRKKSGKPANNRLVASLEDVRLPTLEDLSDGWLSAATVHPSQIYPVELWIRGGTLGDDTERDRVATELAWLVERHQVPEGRIARFEATERDIVFLPAPGALLLEIPDAAPDVYRVAQPSRAVLDLAVAEIAADAIGDDGLRAPPRDAPVVVMADSGIAERHPLLEASIAAPGRSVVPDQPGGFDDHGHGTRMAGAALFDDLGRELVLGSPEPRCRLLGVRFLAGNENGVFPFLPSRTEDVCVEGDDALPDARKIHSFAVGAENPGGQRVTSWSAAIDMLAYNGGVGRIMCVSAGNVPPATRASDYPAGNQIAGLLDPAQAVNAITVGANTDLTTLDANDVGAGLRPLAGEGELSPHSRGNLDGRDAVKPDIVVEGGNAAVDSADGRVPRPALSLTTTSWEHATGRPLAQAVGTSVAVSSASGLLAEIWAAQPSRSPAAIRALLIHSARWTPGMVRQFPDIDDRLRAVGYGVPSRDRVAFSTTGRPTLFREASMDVRVREDAQGRKVRGLHFYALPLPAAELERLGDRPVELSITLSFFAEPNESSLTQYVGAGLRWDIQRSLESRDAFGRRINELERSSDASPSDTAGDLPWAIGPRRRNRRYATVLSDRCQVPAVELSGDRLVGVYPVHGWWKDAERRRDSARIAYSLVVSIDAGDADIDLYTPIRARIPVEVEV
jgi:hypothetical protein